MAVRKCWKNKRFGRVGETDRSNKSKQNNSESSRVNYQEKKRRNTERNRWNKKNFAIEKWRSVSISINNNNSNNRKKMGRPKEGTVQVLVLKNSGIDVGGFGWKSKAGNISVYI